MSLRTQLPWRFRLHSRRNHLKTPLLWRCRLHSQRSPIPEYVYKPLPTSPPTIRLMRIHGEVSYFDDPIFCEIHHASLDSTLGQQYVGLSYVWGEPIFDQTIYCDGCVMKVTCHLHEAIRTLRSHRVSWVWIDAICIDQSNIAERNAQVSIMGRIFKQTQNTFVYLGRVDADGEQVAGLTIRLAFLDLLLLNRSRRDLELLRETDSDELVLKAALQNHPCASERERTWFSQWRNYCMAIFELREFISQEETDRVLQVLGLPISSSGLWRSYAALFGHSSWLRRGWVIQEAVLSPRVRFLLGNQTVDLEDISRSFYFCGFSGLACAGVEMLGPFNHMPGEIMELRYRQGSRALQRLLRTFRECETSDPRDKIYSLLGLAEDLNITAPKPEYHHSEAHVFSTFARYLIQQQHQSNLDILIDAGIALGSTRESGTWVPRWGESLQPPLLTPRPNSFNASGSTKSAFSCGSDTSLLVRGIIYDKVGRFEAEVPDDRSWYSWEREVSSMVQHSPKFSRESYAKALVADFYGYGIRFFNDPLTHSWTFTDLYEHALTGRDPVSEDRVYMNMAVNFNKSLAFVLTHKGNMGWVPRCTEEGDLICIVFGVQMPLVIREIEDGNYILIGAAYIEGIMQGEAFEGANVDTEDIMLV